MVLTLAPGERQAEADPEGCVEMLYVIEGALTLELAGQERVIPAGATTSSPARCPMPTPTGRRACCASFATW